MNLRRLLPVLVGLPLVAAACSGGPGSEEDLVNSLTRDDSFTQGEAECIAETIFGEYGENEEALNIISGASSFDEITGADGVEGFEEFFDNTVSGCTI